MRGSLRSYMHKVTVVNLADGFAVRIPSAIVRLARLREGDSVAVSLDPDGGITLCPGRRTYGLSEPVSGITLENRHPETLWD
jgi:antitoxin component of MazEF toxin-antitoxin module